MGDEAAATQDDREHGTLSRMLYGASKVLLEHLSEGKRYSALAKVISARILNFDLGNRDCPVRN